MRAISTITSAPLDTITSTGLRFGPDRDTLTPGEPWTIAGSGYGANVTLPITFGPESFSITTNDSGDFSLSLTVPPFWVPGVYALSVAGETAPEKYVVLAGPAIRPVVDTLPITVRYGDSLWVTGTGFHPGETISFYLDSIPLHQTVVANSDNGFLTMLHVFRMCQSIPICLWLAEHFPAMLLRRT